MYWIRKFNPHLHHRKSIRLQNHDYSLTGYYFITLCCYNRDPLFGEIIDHKMILNEYGQIVREEWIKSSSIRREIVLDEFVVMPNHFHAIVKIIGICWGDRPVAPEKKRNMPNGPRYGSMGSLMAGYKSSVTKKINTLRGKPGEKVWQRNYFERIIRDDISLDRTRQYIIHNPKNWHVDEFCR